MTALKWLAGPEPSSVDGSRIAVIVAHPDDETIGCGALLARLPEINVIVVTDGAPRDLINARRAGFRTAQAYAQARAGELRAALAIAGIREEQLLMMGVADGEVWRAQISVTHRLAAFFAQRNIETVLTHAFEGGHSDHDGVAYCVHMAAGLLLGRAPAIIEMPFYHQSPAGPKFQTFCDGEDGVVARLLPVEAAKKRAMFEVFKTQPYVLNRFDPGVERFRLAKAYDFRSQPNSGVLRYRGREANLGLPGWMRGEEQRVAADGVAASRRSKELGAWRPDHPRRAAVA